MKCPACGSVMVVVEHKRIELDYCAKCHGVWFDAGEMELLLGSIGVQSVKQFSVEMAQKPETQTTEKKRKCPICNGRLTKQLFGAQPETLVDICPRGHGLWLDGGELEQLTKGFAEKLTKTDLRAGPISFLSETFRAVQK